MKFGMGKKGGMLNLIALAANTVFSLRYAVMEIDELLFGS